MNLITEPYLAQKDRWPESGRHILAQFDAESVVVYQAYNQAIGHFAARNGYFGGGFRDWHKINVSLLGDYPLAYSRRRRGPRLML